MTSIRRIIRIVLLWGVIAPLLIIGIIASIPFLIKEFGKFQDLVADGLATSKRMFRGDLFFQELILFQLLYGVSFSYTLLRITYEIFRPDFVEDKFPLYSPVLVK